MKVVAINGSPHKDGNTASALKVMANEFKTFGIETKIIDIGSEALHGCIGCGHCFKTEEHKCVFKDDILNDTVDTMAEADGIILGSPTYYGSIAGTMKCFLDRAFYSAGATSRFHNKVGTAVAVVRRAGAVDVFNQLRNYLTLAEMVIPPSQYWVIGYGTLPEEVLQDVEGVQTIKRNAQGMAWLMKCIEAGTIEPPEIQKKVRMNFIR